jgi:hypothetical protein
MLLTLGPRLLVQVLGEYYGSLDERRMSVITTTDKMALAQGAMDSMIAKMTYSLVPALLR